MARLWHLTSLDAPSVAVTWTLAFAWAAGIHLPLWLPIVLALAAWTFYIADRLMDARTAHRPSSASLYSLVPRPCLLRHRHHFHWKHRRFFLPLAIVSAFTAVALVLHSMSIQARERNSILAAATLAYFTTVHAPWRKAARARLRLPKELLVGILFTFACVLPVATRISAGARIALILPTLAFIALAWLNCHAIETWESANAERTVAHLAVTLALLTLAAITAGWSIPTDDLHQSRIALLLAAAALSTVLLAWLDRVRRSLDATTVRAAADLALLTPLLLLFL
jgi:hypothetical protein